MTVFSLRGRKLFSHLIMMIHSKQLLDHLSITSLYSTEQGNILAIINLSHTTLVPVTQEQLHNAGSLLVLPGAGQVQAGLPLNTTRTMNIMVLCQTQILGSIMFFIIPCLGTTIIVMPLGEEMGDIAVT